MSACLRSTRSGLFTSIALLLVFVVPVPAHAGGDSWLPLQIGNRWVYTIPGGGVYSEVITTTFQLHGRTVFVKKYIGGPHDGLENYWLTDSDGNVFLAGVNNRAGGGDASGYEPPVKLFATTPSLGLTWDTRVALYDLLTGVVIDSLDFRCEVLEDVSLTVPAGQFHAFGVGTDVTFAGPSPSLTRADRQAFTLDGRLLVTAKNRVNSVATMWYAQGVGVVQFEPGGGYQLQSFGNPTEVARTTWGRVKSLYR
jgi:hypothetical protein